MPRKISYVVLCTLIKYKQLSHFLFASISKPFRLMGFTMCFYEVGFNFMFDKSAPILLVSCYNLPYHRSILQGWHKSSLLLQVFLQLLCDVLVGPFVSRVTISQHLKTHSMILSRFDVNLSILQVFFCLVGQFS